jgi:hypothetical protein
VLILISILTTEGAKEFSCKRSSYLSATAVNTTRAVNTTQIGTDRLDQYPQISCLDFLLASWQSY